MAGRLDVVARKGETFKRDITWRNPRALDGTLGATKDLTGYTGEVRVGAVWEGVVTVIPGPNHSPNIQVVIPSGVTALWTFAALRWLVRMTEPDGETVDLLAGSFTLEEVAAGV